MTGSSTEGKGSSAEPARNYCEVCAEEIRAGAKLCSKCNSAQKRLYSHPDVLLVAKVANVLLIPIAIGLATWWFQSLAERRETLRATLQQTTADVQATADLASDLLRVEKSLTTNCKFEHYQSVQACLSDYVERLTALDEMVGRISWKISTLPVTGKAYTNSGHWKNDYWSKHRPAVKAAYKKLVDDGQLLNCQQDFEGQCGHRVRDALKGFSAQTTEVFCGLVDEINDQRHKLFESIAAEGTDSTLASNMKKHIELSYCHKLVNGKKPAPYDP